MIKTGNKKYWGIGLVGSIIVFIYWALLITNDDPNAADKRLFMPGPLSSGHHQIGIACKACHKKAFNEEEDFQESCESCHGETRVKPFDSHPKEKFTDPRNAALLEKIDVLQCITCHTEHKPDMLHKGGFTQPKDFCVHCHADIAKERPSHEGMDFMSCNNAGCHNFHDNRALYTDFLVKHLHQPTHLKKQQVPSKDFHSRLAELISYPHDDFPVKVLSIKESGAPAQKQVSANDKTIMDDWVSTAHAQSGVTCSACHNAPPPLKASTPHWNVAPDYHVCARCHDIEVNHFQQGKHGMRLKVDLSSMTPSQARLPMQPDSADKAVDCMSCHSAHRFDVQQAAVESCLGCHADQHSLAYKDSPHYALWKKEQAGELPTGSGVSCATCHMPRVEVDVNDWMSRVVVMHNQNATLVPNEKMLRPSCLHCHGLEFSLNALGDKTLINNNFNGQPAHQTDSMRLAEEDQQRHQAKQAAKQQEKREKLEKSATQQESTTDKTTE